MRYFGREFLFVAWRAWSSFEMFRVPLSCSLRRGPSFVFSDASKLQERVSSCASYSGCRVVLVFGWVGSSLCRRWAPVALFRCVRGVCRLLWSSSSVVPAPSVFSRFFLPAPPAPGVAPRACRAFSVGVPASAPIPASAPVPASVAVPASAGGGCPLGRAGGCSLAAAGGLCFAGLGCF